MSEVPERAMSEARALATSGQSSGRRPSRAKGALPRGTRRAARTSAA